MTCTCNWWAAAFVLLLERRNLRTRKFFGEVQRLTLAIEKTHRFHSTELHMPHTLLSLEGINQKANGSRANTVYVVGMSEETNEEGLEPYPQKMKHGPGSHF